MNVQVDPDEVPVELPEAFVLDTGVVERQVARTAARVRARDGAACSVAIAAVDAAAREGRNVMPVLVDAARVGATLGELSDTFRGVFGEFREPDPW